MRLLDIRTMKGMKGGGSSMQSLETTCAVRAWRLVRNERGLDPVAVEVDLLRQEQVFQGEETPRPVYAGCGCLGENLRGELGCGQCPHIRLRTGPYRCRTGPDSLCFGGSPVFARAGTRFESHLGHSVSLFRGLWASECAQTVHLWPFGGIFGGRCCGRVAPSLDFRQRWRCLLVHGRKPR
jgi:hypothetical protein